MIWVVMRSYHHTLLSQSTSNPTSPNQSPRNSKKKKKKDEDSDDGDDDFDVETGVRKPNKKPGINRSFTLLRTNTIYDSNQLPERPVINIVERDLRVMELRTTRSVLLQKKLQALRKHRKYLKNIGLNDHGASSTLPWWYVPTTVDFCFLAFSHLLI
jgi:hypothetical protein